MSASFDLFQDSLQKDLTQLSNQATNLLRSKCTLHNAQCYQQSISQCWGKYEKQCIWQYPKQDECYSNGIYFSKTSGVRFPNNIDPNKISNNQKLFVCASAQLDKTFLKIKKKYLDKIVRSYIGTQTGFFRAFPGIQADNNDGKCVKSYDPSARPWYIEATTGSKNVVIVIDASSSMSGPMIQNMKTSVQTLIGTMSFNNFIGVVVMKNSSEIILYNQLKRAIQQVKTALINGINSIVFQSSEVNYQHALKNVTDEYGAQCQYASNIVIFISASRPTKGLNSLQKLQQKMDVWFKSYKFKFFSYSLSPDAFSLLKSLSCKYEGSAFNISGQDQGLVLLKSIRHYQRQLSRGINIDNPVYTAPYQDFNTKERMITLSMPIYQYIAGTRYIFGAAGVDILMKVLQNNTMSQKQVVKQLVKCISSQPNILDPCYIQYLRPNGSKCDIENCTSIFNYIPNEEDCPFPIRNSIMKASFNKQAIKENDCCGMTVTGATILVSVLSVFIFLSLIAIVGYCVYRYIKKKKDEEQIKLIPAQKFQNKPILGSEKDSENNLQPHPADQSNKKMRKKFRQNSVSSLSQFRMSNNSQPSQVISGRGMVIQNKEVFDPKLEQMKQQQQESEIKGNQNQSKFPYSVPQYVQSKVNIVESIQSNKNQQK